MRIFECQTCGQMLYFENTHCERCGHRLGYLPGPGLLSTLDRAGDTWSAEATGGERHVFCANAAYDACNWMVPAGSGERFCLACRHNRTIPALDSGDNLARWRRLELAKHRLFYTLLRLRLPLATRAEDPQHGLAFDFLADPPQETGPKVMTGHDNGIVTISLKEADDAERERMRKQMGEPYRTLIGHFRHEVGHHFWDILVRDGGHLAACRELFGDDRRDYGEALREHYRNGAPADWQEHYVSQYASTHPWEDFAETWAHYLHIVDTLDTARAFGVRVQPPVGHGRGLQVDIDFDPHEESDVKRLVDAWLPLAAAVNNLNRSMGQPDLYPFILTPAVVRKLGFVHEVVHAAPGH